jgi:hypothetical protein
MRRIHTLVTEGGASLHYRMSLPLSHLNPDQFLVTWSPPEDLQPGDVVVAQQLRTLHPSWLLACEDPNVVAVYDLTQALLDEPDVVDCIKLADVITVPTAALAERVNEIANRVVILPDCLPPQWVASIKPASKKWVVVGWGAPHVDDLDWRSDLQDVPRQLLNAHRIQGRLAYRFIGPNPVPSLRTVVPLHLMPWTDYNGYWANMDLDIGLAPMQTTIKNTYRSWTQVLEYAGRGIVPVASHWGQYPEFIDHGVNGFLVRTQDEWCDFLVELADDTARDAMADAAMSKAWEWTIDKKIHLWEAAYEGVTS